ncbi:MAG: S8 family peptidase [Bacteroidota bacterium]
MIKQFIIAGLFFTTSLLAQKKAPDNWMLLNPTSKNVYGTGAEDAYEKLKDKKAKTVIVAVIDGGTDIEHEDLKDVIWTNAGEIADNGIDDDKNGYIDDVHGWSFLGGKNGDINFEASELARMYQRMHKKYKDADTSKLIGKEINEYAEYIKTKDIFLAEQFESEQQLQSIELIYNFVEKVKKQTNRSISKASINSYIPETDMEKRMKKGLKLAFTFGLKPEEMETELKAGKEHLENSLKYNKMNADSIREYIVGDNINNVNERYYGCNRVKGPDALHGSHVAGIVAAVRNNNIGIKGVANNVKIMTLRAVPNGDERDKDIANAIRYAVDNGASVINMSFGKYYSPDKKLVDEAVQYALSKDVLLVHAAGNDSKNSDVELSFPNRELSSGTIVPNWLEVGANGYKKGKNIIGSFSNYGKTKVDLFAPGVEIYSTVPDNKYIIESGTSMASPAAAGVAALIRSYFPELKAAEVKAVLMKTVIPYKKKVIKPGTSKEKIKLTELCISGGFINADNAVMELMGLNKKK